MNNLQAIRANYTSKPYRQTIARPGNTSKQPHEKEHAATVCKHHEQESQEGFTSEKPIRATVESHSSKQRHERNKGTWASERHEQASQETYSSTQTTRARASHTTSKKTTRPSKPQSYLGPPRITRPSQQRVGDAEQQPVSAQVGLSHANGPHASAFSPTLGCPHLLARYGRASGHAHC